MFMLRRRVGRLESALLTITPGGTGELFLTRPARSAGWLSWRNCRGSARPAAPNLEDGAIYAVTKKPIAETMWRFVHNVIAHPLLFFANDAAWAVRLHDWSSHKMHGRYPKLYRRING